MRCLLLLAASLVSASTPEELRVTSGGVILLQRPSSHLSHVDLDDAAEPKGVLTRLSQLQPSAPQPSDALAAPHFAGTLASFAQLQPVLEHETFSVLISGEWSRWTPHSKTHKHGGPHAFVSSVFLFDWCLFASAIIIFLILHLLILDRLEDSGWHLVVLMIWIAVGLSYNAVIWARFGSQAGISWFAGYLLEFVFLVENIFIFHIVVQAFKTPVKLTTKALHIVVWGQILFELIFFMGLAHWLRSFTVLPYILGCWLICCGFLAANGEPTFEGEIMDTRVCRALTSCLGNRLSPSYQKDGECCIRDDNGKIRVSLLGLVVAVLLTADFLLEIDVVLTKIEELPNPYIAFTSSAVAAFSIPELFFVSNGLLQRFKLLKYGIGFVLVLFGAQMLLSSIYILKPIVACIIIIGVLALCIIISTVMSLCSSKKSGGPAGSALSQVGQGEGEVQVGKGEGEVRDTNPMTSEAGKLTETEAENTDAPSK